MALGENMTNLHAGWLREVAEEALRLGKASWANTCTAAATEIERLDAPHLALHEALKTAQELAATRLAEITAYVHETRNMIGGGEAMQRLERWRKLTDEPSSAQPSGVDFDKDLARLDGIRSTMRDMQRYSLQGVPQGEVMFLLSFIDNLWREYTKANAAKIVEGFDLYHLQQSRTSSQEK